MAMKGYLMQMQPFSVNDGDGIRTTIFLAGCPLHCKWCANPEGLRQHPVVGFYARLCIGCGACAAVCPKGIGIDLNAEREKCVSCGACVAACPKGARKALVSLADADEIIAEAAKHQLFYRNSGGGITFSGGEATAQPELLEYLSSRLYDMGFSLDIESCGYFEFERVRSSLERMDLIFMDLKHMDSALHEKFTGVPNERILENFTRLADLGANIFVRYPYIPGMNDDQAEKIAGFLSRWQQIEAELLPYHKLGNSKYRALEAQNVFEGTVPLKDEVEMLKKKYGFR